MPDETTTIKTLLDEMTQFLDERDWHQFHSPKNLTMGLAIETSELMEHFQWVIALTRVVSAVFRKGGDVTFLVEELRSVYDPNGGYFKKGGVFMPSLVAEIGAVIEKHLKAIGLLESEEMSETTKRILAEKRAEFEASHSTATNDEKADDYPPNATMCGKCSTKAVIVMDGCATCLSCGDSKCG